MRLETLATVQNSDKAQDAKTTAVEDILEQNNISVKDGEAALKALEAILEGASPDDAAALKSALLRWQKFEASMPVSPDDELVDDFGVMLCIRIKIGCHARLMKSKNTICKLNC